MTSEAKCRHGNIIGSCYHDHCRQQNEPSKQARESFWRGVVERQQDHARPEEGAA